MKKLLIMLIPLLSVIFVADVSAQKTIYDQNNSCELIYQNDRATLNSIYNEKVQTSISLEKHFKLTNFRAKNYCAITNQITNSVSFVHKKTGEVYTFAHFHSAEESPDSQLIAIAETSDHDNQTYISSIRFLATEGPYAINKKFDEAINPDDYHMNFSYDSNFLNFYGTKDGEITYNTIDLKKSKVYSNLASNALTYNRWLTGQVGENFEFTGLYPINHRAYVANTDLGEILYVYDNDIVWKVTPRINVSTTRVLAVGSVYVVTISPAKELVLYRKKDGKQFKVITKENLRMSDDELIFRAQYKSSNIVLIDAKNMKTNHIHSYHLDLNTQKMKSINDYTQCGFDLNC